MKRRTLLQLGVALFSSIPARMGLRAQETLGAIDQARIGALADAILPQEIGRAAREAVAREFLRWHHEYRAGADTDHGYGFPRLRKTAPPPSRNYAAELDDLDRRARPSAASFADLPIEARQTIIADAITAARIERLPMRPDGGHLAADLLGFYFNSVEARDRCYRRAIGADTCRGLDGSENRPAALSTGAP